MDWGSLGKQIADMGAQVLGEAIPMPGAGMAADLVSKALDTEKDPTKISQALQDNPDAAAKLKQIEADHEEELKKIAAKTERKRMEEGSERQSVVNDTIQTGYKQGVYWRRAVGWAFAATSVLTVLGVIAMGFYAIKIGKPSIVKQLPNLVSALSPVFYCFLLVLGVAGWHEGLLGRKMAGDEGGLSKIANTFSNRIKNEK